MQYEYKMIQMPVEAAVETQRKKEGAARWLQELVNQQAPEGWEFHRVDQVGTMVRPGLWARIWGAQASHIDYSVVTFRRPLEEVSANVGSDAQAEAFYDPGGDVADTAPTESPEDDVREPATLPPDGVGLVAGPEMEEPPPVQTGPVTEARSTMRVAGGEDEPSEVRQSPRENKHAA